MGGPFNRYQAVETGMAGDGEAFRVAELLFILDKRGKRTKLTLMKIKFLLLAVWVPLFFTGCAATLQSAHFPDQTKVVEDAGKGRIYVIRPGLTGIGIGTEVRDDGKLIGSTGPHGFLCWERAPGNAVITSTAENTSEVQVPVQAGQVNYIVEQLDFGWISTVNRLEVVSEAEAAAALKKCKPPIH